VRVNFVDGGEENSGFLFAGSEGTMAIDGNTLSLLRVPRYADPGLTVDTFPEAMQKTIIEEHRKQYPKTVTSEDLLGGTEKFEAPRGYSDSFDHFANFFASVRSRKPVVEDAVFGYRAAGAALLSNLSVERGAVVRWDPDGMMLV